MSSGIKEDHSYTLAGLSRLFAENDDYLRVL